ncbi:hypothetical protein D1007_15510 [Hordeum vulgare]|nr:hypothetical protein D1007_15510 [Hordeum vulgare]
MPQSPHQRFSPRPGAASPPPAPPATVGLTPTPSPLAAAGLGSPSYAQVTAASGCSSAPVSSMVAGLIPGAAHRRPATSTCSVVSTPEMEDESYRVRTTALLLTAAGPCSGITVDMVAEAVEHDQGFPRRDISSLLASHKTSCWCCRNFTSVTSSSSGASWWWPELSFC